MGYRKVSAAEQVYYIIKYKAAEATASLRSASNYGLQRNPIVNATACGASITKCALATTSLQRLSTRVIP